jgi:tetratricopeptide (TPR) repeat protein
LKTRTVWWPAALIPVFALVAFAPGIRNGYVDWDDIFYIRDNSLLTSLDGLWRIWSTFDAPQYYPLTFTSFWLEYRLWGTWPAGYFVTNLLLHAVNSLLVFRLARALGAGRGAAWVVGALFAVHPLQVASVAWLAQRKNVLGGLFFFLSFLAYVRYCRQGGMRFYVASVLAFAAALLSKTAAVTLPASLVLFEWLLLKRRGGRPLGRVAPMLLIALALGVVTIIVERAGSPATIGVQPQPLAAAAAVWAYLGKVLWPAALVALYPRWHVSATALVWWLPAVALIAAIVAVWHWRRTLGDLPVWGLAHFLVTLLPCLGLVPFGYLIHAPIGDHFLYFALPGLFLAIVCLAERAAAGRRVVYALAGVALLALGAKTWAQVQVWHDGQRLWSYTLAHNPDSALSHNQLGIALAAQDRMTEALAQYREAARLNPRFWIARMNVGIALRDLGRLDEAVEEFRSIVAAAPRDAAAHYNLANALVRQGRSAEAFVEFAEAIRLNPRFAEAYANWGVALVEAGRIEEALPKLEIALRLNPENAVVHFNLGLVLASQGQLPQAVAHYQDAARLQPGNPRIYTNLALALLAQGRPNDAVQALRTALAVEPNDTLAHLNLGGLAAQAGRLPEAEAQFRAVLQIDPNNVEANNNLGVLLVQQGRFADGIPYLSAAVQLMPNHANAHYMLGVALAQLGRSDEAAAEFRRVVELQPDDAEAWEQLARYQPSTSQSTTLPATNP